MLDQFQNLDLFPVDVFDVLSNLLVAFVCGMIIALVYRFIYKGSSYSATYVNSLVLLTLITSVVILVIGNNLARAFGLVGAMSIIRFRTAVRDVQDIVYIFFALSVGMAAGVGLHLVALAATLMISTVSIVLSTFNFGAPQKPEFLLQINYRSPGTEETVIYTLLKKYALSYNLVNLKKQDETHMEAHYQFRQRRGKKIPELVQLLKDIEGVDGVNLFFDENDADPVF